MNNTKETISSDSVAEDICVELLLQAAEEEVDMEQEADSFLLNAGLLGRMSGLYTQRQMNRRIRNERNYLLQMDECDLPAEVTQQLFASQLQDLIDVARLTPIQEIIYRLSIDGLTCLEIARMLKVRRQKVFAHLKSARNKMKTAYNEGIYAGWMEVYLSEVRRGRNGRR